MRIGKVMCKYIVCNGILFYSILYSVLFCSILPYPLPFCYVVLHCIMHIPDSLPSQAKRAVKAKAVDGKDKGEGVFVDCRLFL